MSASYAEGFLLLLHDRLGVSSAYRSVTSTAKCVQGWPQSVLRLATKSKLGRFTHSILEQPEASAAGRALPSFKSDRRRRRERVGAWAGREWAIPDTHRVAGTGTPELIQRPTALSLSSLIAHMRW